MLKVLKYVKKYWLALICIIALLYGQAQAELALPDYMSNIVTYGIQTGGFDEVVPEIISQETMDNAMIFMSDDDKEFVLSQYNYQEFKDIDNKDLPYEIDMSDKSVVKDTGLYVLKSEISDTNFDKLTKAMGEPMLMVTSLESIVNGDTSLMEEEDKKQIEEMLAQIPEGMTIFDMMRMMPQEQLDEQMNDFTAKFDAVGESAIEIAAASGVKAEYAKLGVDVNTIQTNYIMSTGLTMLLISLGGGLCAILVGYFSSRMAAKVSRNMRQDTFEKVESFSSTELNKFSTASLITRTTNDIQQVQMALIMTLRIAIYAPIMAFGAIVRVMNSSTSMVWIIALVVVIIIGVMIATFAIAGPKFRIMQKLVDKLNLVTRESLSGMLVIRAFHTEEVEEERFDEASTAKRKVDLFTSRTMSVVMPIVTFIFSATSLLIVWMASHEIDLGTMQIGDMMAFIQYSMQIIMSFMMLAMISIMLPRAGVAAKRIFEVLETPLSIADPEYPETFSDDMKGFVEFKDVSFRYPGAEEDVLHDINFVAKPRQTTAFIGSTGSGKSTIINLVPRFFDVTSGSIEVDGLDVRNVTQKDLRAKIGLVPQKGVLFSGTIESNIKYSDETMNDSVMEEASEVAQATEFIDSKPERYETEIAQGGSNVSGGQKQRISIARAIAKQPEIFIFDDSFSALDFKTDANLREALYKLCQKTGSTVLLVGQRIASIMNADQIIVLDEGKIVGKGTHNELMKTCEVYQEIAYSQLSKEELENE
ncbi:MULTISPECIES: ABC transporter ATP-binding protein [unclassified Breznakia]|uniref:ABC transporter ATP-binding protein n=1 Tax=unclassified Breznakia TaxID=2623764 RepID=UPI002404A643|nr:MULTISPECIES: ABC transporter ATP-binding protein [unclassified Breznakia]MDF9837687.1 ATP-binding cassette subfamily B multidrug efflux pump [Breznakia sp. PFB2-8]MDF9859551.1 ATP-binding cassette subfamily B multidrug efflux pump [Breznakia sp. PH5-24]